MALADDLKALEELHSRGKLTDQEFATAKTAAISHATAASQPTGPVVHPPVPPQLPNLPKKKSSTLRKLLLLALFLLLIWVYIQSRLTKPAVTLLKEVTHMPVDLRSETFTVPARGWKAVGVEVPYNGSLTIEAQVLGRGNAMEMFLTDENGLEKLKATSQATYLGSFYALKGSSFQHSERMNQGRYYFVVRDRHFGIFSATASDVSLKARVDP